MGFLIITAILSGIGLIVGTNVGRELNLIEDERRQEARRRAKIAGPPVHLDSTSG